VEDFSGCIILEPTAEDLYPLLDSLGLHALSIEDALDENQIPKIDDYPDNIFVFIQRLLLFLEQLRVQEIDLFLGNNFLVSVDRIDPDGKPLLAGIEELVLKEINLDRNGPAFAMYTILDLIVDRKFVAIEALEDELAEAEDAVAGAPCRIRSQITATYPPCPGHSPQVPLPRARSFAEDLPQGLSLNPRPKPSTTTVMFYDHLTRFFELTETLRDVATSLMEIDLSLRSNEMSRAANRTNRSVRRLTFITTIFMPLSLLAGIGGMSEWSMMTGPANWRVAYPAFILFMAAIGIVSYYLLKWMIKRDDMKGDER